MWGKINHEWYMCSKGKNQSPIDIDPNDLLFDPTLKHIAIEGKTITGVVVNTGVDLTVEVNNTDAFPPLNITMGPVSYTYTLAQIKLHFGSLDGSGSEHTVAGEFFDGEMHLIAYNSDVYNNLTHAQNAPRGVVILAAFLQTGRIKHPEFEILTNLSQLVLYQGQRARLKELNLASLLPNIEYFMTYEGSFTQPGCYESVTWIVFNRPINVHQNQIEALRNLRQRDITYPQAFMADNNRPVMPSNRRPIRTNINFKRDCTMKQDMHYQLNRRLRVKK
ncbi:carbonic anhydrase-related protein 10-like [Dreissena polymorpha]|nr:carbonic anhydrase-related protein 10-like [Dreissena polymorpha]